MWLAIIIIAVIVICVSASKPAATPKAKEKPIHDTEISDEDMLLMWMLDEDK